MAVEAQQALDRQIVSITWDKSIVTGEVVQLFCVNPANGDVSNSGLSKNDGEGFVSYPNGYSGTSEITVYDNDGNADYGVITVSAGSVDTDPDAEIEHPIVLPPETDLKPEHPIVLPPEGGGDGGEHPTHPIVLPPLGIWGDIELPDNTLPGDLPFPSHPIVIPPDANPSPPDLGYNPPIGAQHPEPQN